MSQIRQAALLLAVAAAVLSGCSTGRQVTGGADRQARQTASNAPLDYTVDLTTPEDDAFEVMLDVRDLSAANTVYQFASTAPGAYEVMDIGRYVRSFTAFDRLGQSIPVAHVSTNRWRISRPEDVARIVYSIADTWDTPVKGHAPMLMGGTSIEADHVLFNGNAVLGFPTGMQQRPIRLELDRPAGWMVGTALLADDQGRFIAESYDKIVDSPILLGRLTEASLDVRGSKVDIYTYSMTGKVTSDMVLDATRDILNAAGAFLRRLPVKRYTFLFHFGDPLSVRANDTGYVGAWEHSYSSEYVLDEATFREDLQEQIPSFVAHEFFHIVTPLNIHSEIIEQFNFVTPVPSEHLWLYEGTTEWVAQTMQLRAGLIDLQEYLDRMAAKLRHDDSFDKSMSLTELSLQSYTEKGQEQYPNIYERGAVVAALLDLRLLELSGGKRGLREVLLELEERYGPHKAFDEAAFFDTFTRMTYPEIGQFFDDYVRHARPLPVAEYFRNVGIDYVENLRTGRKVPELGLQLGVSGGRFVILGTTTGTAACGFLENDVILKIQGETLDLSSAQELLSRLARLDAGVRYKMQVERGGDRTEITCQKELSEYVARHVFTVDSTATQAQLALRRAWTHNLD